MRPRISIRLVVAAIALSAGLLSSLVLAGAGSSAITSSSGTWISTIPTGSSTREDFTQLATGAVSNDRLITTETDVSPSSAFNPSGDGVVAWENTSGGYVEASFIKAGGRWSEPELVGVGVKPVVAVDSAGDAVVVFQDVAPRGDSVAYAYSPAGSGSFNSPVQIDGRTPEASPRVVFDSSGNAWVSWSDSYGYGPTPGDQVARLSATQLASGAQASSQGDPVSVSTLGGSGAVGRVAMATSAGGGVVAAWAAPVAGDPFSDDIEVAYAAPGQNAFGPAKPMPGSGGGASDPAVAMNDAGDAVVAWDKCPQESATDLCIIQGRTTVEVDSATASQLGGAQGPTFSAAESLAPAGQGGDLGVDSLDRSGEFAPAVAVNDNEVAVAWEDEDGSFVIDGAVEPLNGLVSDTPKWAELSGIPAADDTDGTGTPYGGGPHVAIDTAGDVALAWNDGDAINVAAALGCAATCPSMTVTQLDTRAGSGGQHSARYRPALASDENGELLLSWVSDDDPHVSPATVAAVYDTGPALTNIQIPTTATARTPADFSVGSSDVWSGLSGAVTTTWTFGDGDGATGTAVSHTYGSGGTYTVTVVSQAADGASSTISRQIVVSAAVAPATTITTTVPSPTWTGAAWRSRSSTRRVAAEFTVPALVCSTRATAGQELGVELRGEVSGKPTPLIDFAGVDVKCSSHRASYRPTFTIANVGGDSTMTRPASLRVAPGDLVSVQISHTSTRERLTLTDLSAPTESSASASARLFATHSGWQVGAFPIPGVRGPVQTLATGFINVKSGGTGVSHLKGLSRSKWGQAKVSRIGADQNQFSVLYHRIPQPRVGGGSNAIPANGSNEYELPGTHKWVRLRSSARLPNGTVIDASSGTVQLTSSEPGGQTQSVAAWGGQFKVTNTHNGGTVLTVKGTWDGSGTATTASVRSHGSKKKKPVVTGNLWSKGHGNMTTKGSYGSAAVLGTRWLTRNTKSGTLFRVAKNRLDTNDSIKVTVDYPERHTVTLRQGESLLAPAPVKRKPMAAVTLGGATESDGRYNVKIGGTYELTAVSRATPVYVYAAVSPLGPLGGDAPFQPDGSVNGTPRWSFHFYLSTKLANFHYWVVGAKINGKVYEFRLRIS